MHAGTYTHKVLIYILPLCFKTPQSTHAGRQAHAYTPATTISESILLSLRESVCVLEWLHVTLSCLLSRFCQRISGVLPEARQRLHPSLSFHPWLSVFLCKFFMCWDAAVILLPLPLRNTLVELLTFLKYHFPTSLLLVTGAEEKIGTDWIAPPLSLSLFFAPSL